MYYHNTRRVQGEYKEGWLSGDYFGIADWGILKLDVPGNAGVL